MVMEEEPEVMEKQSRSESLADLTAKHKKSKSREPESEPKQKKKEGSSHTMLYVTAIVAAGAAAYSLVRKVDNPDWKEDIRKMKGQSTEGQEGREAENRADRKDGIRKLKFEERETDDREREAADRMTRADVVASGGNRYGRSYNYDDRFPRDAPSRRANYWDDDRDREKLSSRSADYWDYNNNGRYETSLTNYREQPSVGFDDRVTRYQYQDTAYRDVGPDTRDDRYRQDDAYDDGKGRRSSNYYDYEPDQVYYTRNPHPPRDYR